MEFKQIFYQNFSIQSRIIFIHGQEMELSRFLREFFNTKSYHLYSWIMYSRIMQKFLATSGRYCTGFWPLYIYQHSKTLAYLVKFGRSEKNTKFEKIFLLKFDVTQQRQILSRRFFEMCPSQKVQTLLGTFDSFLDRVNRINQFSTGD